jgi:ABC-type multidrug transport system ATPase subunit
MVAMQRPEDHFTEMTVGDQVASYSARVLLPTARVALLARVGLPAATLKQPLRELSSGQQRLLAIACALTTDAQFLALDEPMAGLDAGARDLVRTALRGIVTEGRAGVLIVSHHPDDLLGLVDRLLILEQARLVYDGPLACAPLPALEACIAEPTQSLYYTLRRLDERGSALPPEIYTQRDLAQIGAALARGGAV